MNDNFTNLFMQFIKDKPTAIKSILDDIERNQNLDKGMVTFLSNIDSADMDEENIRKKLKTLMKVIKAQNSMILKLIILHLTYIQGKTFDSDVANLLVKFGRGDEALKAMFKNKMEGK